MNPLFKYDDEEQKEFSLEDLIAEQHTRNQETKKDFILYYKNILSKYKQIAKHDVSKITDENRTYVKNIFHILKKKDEIFELFLNGYFSASEDENIIEKELLPKQMLDKHLENLNEDQKNIMAEYSIEDLEYLYEVFADEFMKIENYVSTVFPLDHSPASIENLHTNNLCTKGAPIYKHTKHIKNILTQYKLFMDETETFHEHHEHGTYSYDINIYSLKIIFALRKVSHALQGHYISSLENE